MFVSPLVPERGALLFQRVAPGFFVRPPDLFVRPFVLQRGPPFEQGAGPRFFARRLVIQQGTARSSGSRRQWEESDFEAQVQGTGNALKSVDRGRCTWELELGNAPLRDAEALREVGLGQAGLGARPAEEQGDGDPGGNRDPQETLALPQIHAARRARRSAAGAQLGGQPAVEGGLGDWEDSGGGIGLRLAPRQALELREPHAVLLGHQGGEPHEIIITQV